LRGAALGLLSRRDYTTSELRKKLLDREYETDAVDTLIHDLTASRLLDDRRVAASHVRTATAIKGRGRLRIARELAARGLPKDIVGEALAGVERQDEAAAIRKILTRKKWPANPSLADRRRMFQHLLRRGFPSDAIGKALGGSVTTGDDE
jgi:regulatory protein